MISVSVPLTNFPLIRLPFFSSSESAHANEVRSDTTTTTPILSLIALSSTVLTQLVNPKLLPSIRLSNRPGIHSSTVPPMVPQVHAPLLRVNLGLFLTIPQHQKAHTCSNNSEHMWAIQ